MAFLMQILQKTCPQMVVTSLRPPDSNCWAVSMQTGHVRVDLVEAASAGSGTGMGLELVECLAFLGEDISAIDLRVETKNQMVLTVSLRFTSLTDSTTDAHIL